MSIVAEFARELHESAPASVPRHYEPVEYPAQAQRLHEMRAVIFDVYGTLIDYRKPQFDEPAAREASLLSAFRAVVERFGVGEYLRQIHPASDPARTLCDFYHHLIALDHSQARRDDIQTPEVRIERIWGLVLMMLKRRGYDPSAMGLGTDHDVAKCMAYFYHFHALNRGFFPGVAEALTRLSAANIRLGLLSNAQFYTTIDLTLFLREQSAGRYDDFRELFDPDLTFFSYEYGVAKPGRLMFEKLFNALYEYHILPSQAVFAGNDLLSDIGPAHDIGLRTALFCGDRRSTMLHDAAGSVVPDLCFGEFAELPDRIWFHAEKKEGV